MNEESGTAYLAVWLYVAVFISLLIVSVVLRRPNPKVTIPLTYPSPSQVR